MSGFLSNLESVTVSAPVFKRLRQYLLGRMAGKPVALSSDELTSEALTEMAALGLDSFLLLVSGQQCLLMVVEKVPSHCYRVYLCDSPQQIEEFLALPWLGESLVLTQLGALQKVRSHLATLSSSDTVGGQELQDLLQLVAEASRRSSGDQSQSLLGRSIERLRQPLALASRIQDILEDVCGELGLQRLVIYQLEGLDPLDESELDAQTRAQSDPESEIGWAFAAAGAAPHRVTHEARRHRSVPSLLNRCDPHCFGSTARFSTGERYFTVEDVDRHYGEHSCLLRQLQQAQVGSKLLAPLRVQPMADSLWGLLIAHRSPSDRDSGSGWTPQEGELLAQIADLLALAIGQDAIAQQLQHQEKSLNAQVSDRTQKLKDALIAAEAANQTKSEFLATMSHELRTPLTYIIGMSATLLRWSFGELSPRQRDYLNTIHSSGEQLLDIINDILDVAKIEAGRTVLEINDFSLSNLVRSSLESFRSEASAKGVDLRINLRVGAFEDSFRADPRRIRQILSNLLSNAVKFTDAGGRVTLRIWRDSHQAIFQVEDTGIGIPEAQQASLFEKFKQLEDARQRQYPGTGLGLALTKQLIELHNGSIQVVSTPGKGSMFTVRIPLQNADGSPEHHLSMEPVTGRIILLEDDEASASLICDLLTAANYQVIWVIEGSRIAHQVEILQPVVIIVNHHLVSGSSQYIIDDLRRYVATSGIKVVTLVSADEATRMHQTAPISGTGFDSYLVKPIEPATLMRTVQSITAVESV